MCACACEWGVKGREDGRLQEAEEVNFFLKRTVNKTYNVKKGLWCGSQGKVVSSCVCIIYRLLIMMISDIPLAYTKHKTHR